jgi:hypothetical protein
MFKVSDFLNHFGRHNDFAKTSKFEVRISPPNGIPDLNSYDLRFQCETTELPGYNINAVENRIYGVSTPVASTAASFADITLTFICSGDMWEKKMFDRWMNAIVPINNYNPRYRDDYTSPKIEINQYTDIYYTEDDQEIPANAEITASEQKIYSAVLFNAFPISIAPLSLNWSDDNFHRLAVTFKYDYWSPGTFDPFKPATVNNNYEPNGSLPPIGRGIET